MTKIFVVARTASGHPACQHRIAGYRSSKTMCGYDVSKWSREFTATALSVILCKRCKRLP